MKYFDLDIKKLSVELLPTFLRKPVIVAFLVALTAPLISIYRAFTKYRKNTNYRLNHNGQVCYLRKVLNDRFDPIQRRIEIGDISRKEPLYIFTVSENLPLYIFTENEINGSNNTPQYLFTDTETGKKSAADFIVKLPSEIYAEQQTQTENRLRFYDLEKLIDTYKLASKHYKITEK